MERIRCPWWLQSYLARVVETFPDDTVHDDPGQEEEAEEISLNSSNILDTITDVEHFVTETTTF